MNWKECARKRPWPNLKYEYLSIYLEELKKTKKNVTQDSRFSRQSQSHFMTGGLPPIISFWRQAAWDSRPVFFFFQLNTFGYSPYVTSSLMRGWVCRLQLLLGLASAVILSSESRGTMTIFYCLRFETPPTWRTRSPYLYPPWTGWPGYAPTH
jgi:hypothetical protein